MLRAADLFCGAGGASTGLRRACARLGLKLELIAVNHWHIAIATHSANHPDVKHLCEDLDTANPRKAVPGGRLDLLLAGPECVHHSTARGGKPVNDQSRASAWCVLRWATALTIDTILIENVREFLSWGPLGSNGRPLKSRKGETFHAFIEALRSLGYRVEWRVFNAADYGDPTTRERLFIQARRGRRPISWPEPTHSPRGEPTLFGPRKAWRPARDIIDWSIPGKSIFGRKKALSPNTLARIAAGLQKFGGKAAEPFLVLLNSTDPNRLAATARSLDTPAPTVTGSGHLGLVQPFLVPTNYGERPGQARRCHSVDAPFPTVVGSQAHALVEPFIIGAGGPRGMGPARSVNDPLRTILTRDPLPGLDTSNRYALIEPFIVPNNTNNLPKSLGEPVPTLTGANRLYLVEPFIISMEHSGANGKQVRSLDSPLATLTTRGDLRLVKPFVVPTNHGASNGGGRRAYPLDRPMPTITTVDAWGLIEPYLVRYNNNRPEVCARSLAQPLPTADCTDRYGLVTTVGIDIRFRMLQPHELAAAMSFPRDYRFAGTREQKVKQIGNAWPGALAEALCVALLKDESP